MEGKTKSIILGVAVVVGMAIILFPFFQNSGEVATSTTLVKAPPFPDQAVQVQASEPVPVGPVMVDKTDTTPSIPAPAEEENNLNSTTNVEPVQQETPTPDVEQQKAVSAQAPEPVKEEPKVEQPAPKPVAVNKAAPTPVKIAKAIAKKIVKPIEAKGEIAAEGDDGLFSLKNPAWVVQLGSFKNKANALRLVNQLRANGYSAFIQRFSSAVGDSTRVFVGPEKKPEHARQLASHIEKSMNMHGIVISYKPLTL